MMSQFFQLRKSLLQQKEEELVDVSKLTSIIPSSNNAQQESRGASRIKHSYKHFVLRIETARYCIPLADPGGRRQHTPLPPNRIQFFHFHICFCQKAPMSEVSAPQWLGAPQTGNPGSATDSSIYYGLLYSDHNISEQNPIKRIIAKSEQPMSNRCFLTQGNSLCKRFYLYGFFLWVAEQKGFVSEYSLW